MIDLTNLPEENEYSPVPAGIYIASISATFKDTQKGIEYLSVAFSLQNSKRIVYKNFLIFHEGKAGVIAKTQLKALLLAVKTPVSELAILTKEKIVNFLAEKVVEIEVYIKDNRNEIKTYKEYSAETIPF